MAVFPAEPGQVLPWSSFSTCFEENLYGLVELVFYGPDVLPAMQPSVSKHWKEHKALTLTSGIVSSFFSHPDEIDHENKNKGHNCILTLYLLNSNNWSGSDTSSCTCLSMISFNPVLNNCHVYRFFTHSLLALNPRALQVLPTIEYWLPLGLPSPTGPWIETSVLIGFLLLFS